MTDIKRFVRGGVGIMLKDGNKILFGKRHDDPEKASSDLHGEGTWTFPGGKCDFGETYIESAYRELLEETSIKMNKNKAKVFYIKDQIVPDAHFLTVGIICEDFEGTAKAMEPEEITKWEWFDIDNLPSPIFKPNIDMIKSFKNQEYKTLFYAE